MKKRSRGCGVRMMTVGEFGARFGDEERCGEQLSLQRWPEGFACPRCVGPSRGYMSARRIHECARCSYQCPVTAGTIFHKTRTPLASWSTKVLWAVKSMARGGAGAERETSSGGGPDIVAGPISPLMRTILGNSGFRLISAPLITAIRQGK